MTWTSPPTVATGDLYTAAMFNTYTRDNPNHLRTLLGGADPGGANKVLLSSGSATSTWTSVVDTTIFTNEKINRFPPIATSFAGLLANYSGFFNVNNGGAAIVDAPTAAVDWYCMQIRYPNAGIDYRVQIAFAATSSDIAYIRWILGGSPTGWAKIWLQSNDGSGSGLDADTLDGNIAGNSSNQIAINNAVMCTGLNSQYLQGYTPGNTSGAILAINNGVLNVGLNADQVDSHHAADITPNNGRMWFATVAELTAAGAHWTRDDTARGRLLVSADEAGVVLPYDIQPNTNYGSAWTPTTGLSASSSAVAASAATVAIPPDPFTVPFIASSPSHTHPAPTISLSGVGATWFPPMRGVIWGKKV